jgi:hypothetical protein
MPEERRRSDDVRIVLLTERVENWMATTTEYRKSLCAKLDIITERVNKLPCEARMEAAKGVRMQLNALWWIVALLITSSFGLAVAWGAVNKQVDINTQHWEKVIHAPGKAVL